MQIELELLAPAKNKSIGIAAINCGADAVYIAGPKFGAREAAGNSIPDIAELVSYAHKFRAKVYMVINTILYDNELEEARKTVEQAYQIGCDAIIVQDLALLKMELPPIELFASTQTNIRTIEQAKLLESLGFKRLILARELSLQQISAIKNAVTTDLESFIHGALCVSYSGQCYLSQKLTGRSANRGCCAQACRSNYTLEDSSGEIIIKNAPLLSLKDLNLSNKIPQLIEAGITSFKIEGRLKNESYIKNIVLHYRREIDKYIVTNKNYRQASYGCCAGGFQTNPNLTFNRGYTELFISGERGKWRSEDGAKHLGEYIGKITESSRLANGTAQFKYNSTIKPAPIHNGDGLCFVTPKGEILGARANSCTGNTVSTTERILLPINSKVYRNYNIDFERELERNLPKRMIPVEVIFTTAGEEEFAVKVTCLEEIKFLHNIEIKGDIANNIELAKNNIATQLSKTTEIFSFSFTGFDNVVPPFYPISALNKIRREIAQTVEAEMEKIRKRELEKRGRRESKGCKEEKSNFTPQFLGKELNYLTNSSNKLSKELYNNLGATSVADAYEIKQQPHAELMRTKYCIKFELGLCPKQGSKFTKELFLINGKNRLELKFDCKNCEMLIIG